jgi:hypothetical protein
MDISINKTNNLPISCNLNLLYTSSLVVAGLMAIVSLISILFQSDVYPTEELRQSFLPNDVINLCIGLPILLGSLWLSSRGKLIGLLFWPGALFYVFYSYLVYILSMPFSMAFLIHLMLVSLSAYSMISLIANINGISVKDQLDGHLTERLAGGVLATLGFLFFLRATLLMVSALIDKIPLHSTEIALNVVDFFISPALIICGVLLWRREAFGYVSGLGLLFQTSMLFIGLIFILILQPLLTEVQFVLSDVLVISVMGMVCFIPFALFVRGVVSGRSSSPN